MSDLVSKGESKWIKEQVWASALDKEEEYVKQAEGGEGES